MGTLTHFNLDIRGALMNWNDRDFLGAFVRKDGSSMTPREAKAELLEQLAKGRDCLPIGHCDGFDYHNGCPGHATDDIRAA